MDPEFWLARWQEGKIGFHEGRANTHLAAHAPLLGSAPQRVFVPLCGKAFDLEHLASLGHEVVGAELSAIAAEAFFSERGLVPTRRKQGAFDALSARGVTILVGDFFALRAEDVGAVNCAYDRAALVALPPAEQPRYATKLVSLLPPGAPILLVTFAYDQAKMQGPPFSVPADAVHALFGRACTVQCIEDTELREERSRFREAGIERVVEGAWLLTKR